MTEAMRRGRCIAIGMGTLQSRFMEKASAMLAVLACLLAAFVAPFASADDTAADAAQLPDHIVSRDFEYHSDITGNSWGWAAVIPTTGENYSGRWQWQAGPSDWDETKFGWHSTQNCDDGGNAGPAPSNCSSSGGPIRGPKSSPPVPTPPSIRTSA